MARFDANLKWLFTEVPFAARFDAAADAGFTAVEVPDPYSLPARAVRRLADAAGLSVVLVNTPQGPPGSSTEGGSACLPAERAGTRSGALRALEYAAELRAPYVHLVGGRVAAGEDRAAAREEYLLNVAWAAEQSRGTGVTILLEVQNQIDAPGFVLPRQRDALSVIDEVGSGVGLLLDVYHAFHCGDDPLALLAERVDAVRHIQVADPVRRSEPHSDALNWARLFAEADSSAYTGWVGCEYRPSTTTTAGLSWKDPYET